MASTTDAPTRDPGHAHHPGPRDYVRIFVILAVLTALEISVHVYEYPARFAFWFLVVLAAAKFMYVILFYMHLKFDSTLFNRLFGFGVVLALAVFGLTMAIMLVFTAGGPLTS